MDSPMCVQTAIRIFKTQTCAAGAGNQLAFLRLRVIHFPKRLFRSSRNAATPFSGGHAVMVKLMVTRWVNGKPIVAAAFMATRILDAVAVLMTSLYMPVGQPFRLYNGYKN
uniref:hypothetical protein n=1 Tax=Neorhizobium sp. EC2-8 TaxID=3129230 RepID=UPI0031016CE6